MSPGDLMKTVFTFLLVALISFAWIPAVRAGAGMTPEQIYTPALKWKRLVGTWEILPDDNPLAQKRNKKNPRAHRMLMTLRKDGTCRIFNDDYPDGSDGLWTFENHKMFITLPDATGLEFYVYGVKGEFMITRSPVKNGRDQLWSRVK
jgi:hypothetical protein